MPKTPESGPKAVTAYIAKCPPRARAVMKKIRVTVRAVAPDAEEIISYRMPAFRQGRILIWYAAFTNHIGVYPPVRGNAALLRAVKKYAGPKGNLSFLLDEAMPYGLIKRIVKTRLKQAK